MANLVASELFTFENCVWRNVDHPTGGRLLNKEEQAAQQEAMERRRAAQAKQRKRLYAASNSKEAETSMFHMMNTFVAASHDTYTYLQSSTQPASGRHSAAVAALRKGPDTPQRPKVMKRMSINRSSMATSGGGGRMMQHQQQHPQQSSSTSDDESDKSWFLLDHTRVCNEFHWMHPPAPGTSPNAAVLFVSCLGRILPVVVALRTIQPLEEITVFHGTYLA